MSIVYAVRPDQPGVRSYNSWCIEHAWVDTPWFDVKHDDPSCFAHVVQRCVVRPNSVCEHGWFCTDNREVAVMVDKLRGERAATVSWLRRNGGQNAFAYWNAADCIERGEHRREEEP